METESKFKNSETKDENTFNYLCWMCMEKFQLEEDFQKHQKLHMRTLKLVEKESSLENPRKSTADDKFLCVFCNEEFLSETTRNQHLTHVHPHPFDSDTSTNTDSEEYEYYGDPEAQSLLSFSLLEEGEMVEGNTEIKMEHDWNQEGSGKDSEEGFNCEVCHRHFSRKQALKNHMYIHNGLPKPHQCPFQGCPRSFIKAIEMRRHFFTHNPEVDRPKNFRCDRPGCYKTFAFQSDLKKHQMIHDNPLIRKYQCQICDKSFSRSEHLKRHRLIHLPEDQIEFHVCPITSCGRKFRRKDGLTKHLLTHNEKKDITFPLVLPSPVVSPTKPNTDAETKPEPDQSGQASC